jgi:hypothetical protein
MQIVGIKDIVSKKQTSLLDNRDSRKANHSNKSTYAQMRGSHMICRNQIKNHRYHLLPVVER